MNKIYSHTIEKGKHYCNDNLPSIHRGKRMTKIIQFITPPHNLETPQRDVNVLMGFTFGFTTGVFIGFNVIKGQLWLYLAIKNRGKYELHKLHSIPTAHRHLIDLNLNSAGCKVVINSMLFKKPYTSLFFRHDFSNITVPLGFELKPKFGQNFLLGVNEVCPNKCVISFETIKAI